MSYYAEQETCPFCDWEVWSWTDVPPCEHLLMDWPGDPYDNAGGVLGDMFAGPNAGITGGEELGRLCIILCGWVWTGGEEMMKARLDLAANAVGDEKPAWWKELQERIAHCENPNVFLGLDWDDLKDHNYDYYGDPETTAELLDDTVEAIVDNLPGISVTYSTPAGMASSTHVFVWSEDPVSGRAAIDEAVASATKTLKMILAKVAKPGSSAAEHAPRRAGDQGVRSQTRDMRDA
jgi:hypothetical protein